ncbi:MAG: hypothetical protein KTR31_38155 [Myxococcales bacterium]|nr:hypothetical protein [Myxococcales bacterium]
MLRALSLSLVVVAVGCEPDPVQTAVEQTTPDDTTEPDEILPKEEEVDARVRWLAFGMRFGVAEDGVTFVPVTTSTGEELQSEVRFVIGNRDKDQCGIVVPIDGLQLEVLTEGPYAYAFQVPDADLAVTDCTSEHHDTSWFPGGDAVSHVSEWRFSWGGELNPDVFDWTDVQDGEDYYLGAKVAGPLMSAPVKDVVFVRGYEVDADMTLLDTPILAADLVGEAGAPTAAYEFTVPWSVVYDVP